MGVRIIANDDDAAIYCSTTGQAFGPIFHANAADDAETVAQAFLDWLAPMDARRLTADELNDAYGAWLASTHQGQTL
jgi:hypothetical protein